MQEDFTPAQKRQAQDMSVHFPSKDLICKNCIYRRSGVLGYRTAYCEMYPRGKPSEILFRNANCQWYVEESTA